MKETELDEGMRKDRRETGGKRNWEKAWKQKGKQKVEIVMEGTEEGDK